MQSEDKECLRLLVAGRYKNLCSMEPSEEAWRYLSCDFELLAPIAVTQ